MKKSAPLQNTFAVRTQAVYFGDQPIFATNNLSRPINVQKSPFGHLAFGSNLPSFQSVSGASKMMLHSDLGIDDAADFLYVRKEVSSVSFDVPDVLSAVGLVKLNCDTPKCYGKKPITLEFPAICHSDITLNGYDFDFDYAFGKMD